MKISAVLALLIAFIPLPACSLWQMRAVFGSASYNSRQISEGLDLPVGAKVFTGASGTLFGLIKPMGVLTNTYPISEISLASYEVRPDGSRRATLVAEHGITDIRIPHLNGAKSNVRIYSRYGVTDVHGTKLTIRSTDDSTTIGVTEGRVTSENLSVPVDVNARYYTIIRPGMPPTPPAEADYDLALKSDSTVLHDGKARVYVANGNTILDSAGKILGDSAAVKVGDKLRVVSPLYSQANPGTWRDYTMRLITVSSKSLVPRDRVNVNYLALIRRLFSLG